MTKADVFIIESLDSKDEEDEDFEGGVLSQILHLGGKESKYYYLRTGKKLKEVLRTFGKSDYRYLHLSCHGNEEEIVTTLDHIKFAEFGRLVRPYLKDRRLFISACQAVNKDLAKAVIPSSGCRSLIGANTNIKFSDAAIMWTSFYLLVFKVDKGKMTRQTIEPTLQRVVDAFRVPLNSFWRNDSGAPDFERITPKKKQVSKRVLK